MKRHSLRVYGPVHKSATWRALPDGHVLPRMAWANAPQLTNARGREAARTEYLRSSVPVALDRFPDFAE
jgi:hypothetical protein